MQAHYDDLKDEFDGVQAELERCRADLATARRAAAAQGERLGEATAAAARMPGLEAQLEQAQGDLKVRWAPQALA